MLILITVPWYKTATAAAALLLRTTEDQNVAQGYSASKFQSKI